MIPDMTAHMNERPSPWVERFLPLITAGGSVLDLACGNGRHSLLVAERSALDKGQIPIGLGLWPVHALFLVIGLLLVYWQSIQLRVAQWRANKEAQHA